MRSFARLATLLATGAVLAASTGAAAGQSGTAEPRTAARATPRTTALTFTAPGCDGCTITLVKAFRSGGRVHYWSSKERTVRDGAVTFTPRSRRTIGMSALVGAPWEGTTGYVTEVVFRYGGEQTGDAVTLAEARTKRRGSGCWAGTNAGELTVPLTIRKVRVQGTTGRTWGTIAFTSATERWGDPMEPLMHGVLGTQDVELCGSD